MNQRDMEPPAADRAVMMIVYDKSINSYTALYSKAFGHLDSYCKVHIQTHASLFTSYLNALRIRGGTGGEDKRANEIPILNQKSFLQ